MPSQKDVNDCLQAGMNDFVVKPVRKKVLIGAILRAISGGVPDTAHQHPAGETPPNLPGLVVPAGAASIVDPTAFDNLAAEIGEEAASETLHMFLADTENRLKLLRQLSCETDRDVIENEAHSLKGTAATFGLCEVTRLAAILEREAASVAATEYFAVLDGLDAAFAGSRAQLPADF